MSSQPPQNGNAAPQAQSSAKPFSLSLGGGGGGGTSTTPNRPPKKTSFNIQSSARSTDSPSRTTLTRRPHHHLHDDDESDTEEAAPVHEAVTGFDTLTGTAISANEANEKPELVIPVSGNNNWRNRPGVNLRKPKGKNLLPKEVQAMQEAQKRGEVPGENVDTERPSMAFGLTFAQPGAETEAVDKNNDQAMPDSEPAAAAAAEQRKPLTQDEIALQALIRDSKGETEGRTDLVIESVNREKEDDGDQPGGRYDESTSFRADVASRPESASLDQYNAIPVEEFGAALLRGMGWKEGEAVGRGKYGGAAGSQANNKPRVPERRPGFLGIGAKDASGGKGAEAEFGAWGKAAMRKGSRRNGKEGDDNTEGVYMPIMMRNSKTGEFITEEELAIQRKEAKKRGDEDEWKERRDRNLEKSGRDKDRDRDSRRRDYDDDDSDRYERRSRTGSSKRDRSLSSGDRQSRRRRHGDDDSDSRDDRYYRDRDRDRDRDYRRNRDRNGDRNGDRARERERDKDRDRSRRYRDDDRHSSRHSSSHTSSRHRDRGRDSDRDRDRDRDSYRRRRDDDR
ncbi:hypothetical protein BO71DRAFT_399466 [Aspergillus ellipticus CBS 707.79]|uniref:Pre-mRNA-splicing factor n=1 Tax=Aspergillus ellipticus CBS 707.79 TaxID=1448320 RepID=A0A319D9C0_9EURO|nr:hypothetical protein BO71DRAFT_399466 [Aspergillus ellipticus CBS 707.79]